MTRHAPRDPFVFHAKHSKPNVYVFGPESSGTRYLSRGISLLYDKRNKWDGESPPCHGNVQHISLPWGSVCNKARHRVVDDVDLCTKSIGGRWFANVTSVLLKDRSRKAILIARDNSFTLRSVTKHHCFLGQDVAQKEHDLAISLIRQAIDVVPNQVLLVSYESMANFPKHEWRRIVEFLGIDHGHLRHAPVFKNGNVF